MDNVTYIDLISDDTLTSLIGDRFFFECFLPEYRKSVGVIYSCNGRFYFTVEDTVYTIYKLLNDGNK